jgi:C4-dicarboxylate transporter DctM subunit
MLMFAYTILVMCSILVAGGWIFVAVGAAGLYLLYSEVGSGFANLAGMMVWKYLNSWSLLALPLFVFMGELAQKGGFGEHLYSGLSRLMRGLRGGMVQSNIVACAAFAAISGSSIATSVSIGTVVYSTQVEMGYNKRTVIGSLAAGGTLGPIIPPSIAFVIYGAITEQSIATLFLAGLVPGIILAALFMMVIAFLCKGQAVGANTLAKNSSRIDSKEILMALKSLVPAAVLITCMLGGIFSGLVTPTEAAGLSVVLVMILCTIYGTLNLKNLREAMAETMKITGMIMIIIACAGVLTFAAGFAGIIVRIEEFIQALNFGRWGTLALIYLVYLVLGCLLDPGSIMLITVPFFYPIVVKTFGFDPIWFGVVVVILNELGNLTPPFGLHLFVLQGISGEPFDEVVRGCVPFLYAYFAMLALITAFPILATWCC